MNIVNIISLDCKEEINIDLFSDEWKNKPFFKDILFNTLDFTKLNGDELLSCAESFNYLCIDSPEFLHTLLLKIQDRDDVFIKYDDEYICSNYHLNILLFDKYKKNKYSCGDVYKSDFIEDYLKSNNLKMVKYLAEKSDNKLYKRILDDALRCECNLEILEWLKENKCEIFKYSMEDAIKKCSLDTIKWLFKNNKIILNHRHLSTAVLRGDLNIIKWLLDNGCNNTRDVYNEAIEYGSVDNLKWLYEHGFRQNASILAGCDNTMDKAIKKGKLEIVKWADEIGFKFSENTMQYAILSNRLEIVEWLFKNGHNFNEYSFNSAAKSGNLDIMKYLLSNGCKFSENTFDYAIFNGDLNNIKWLKENDCEYHHKYSHIKQASKKVINWLKENKYID